MDGRRHVGRDLTTTLSCYGSSLGAVGDAALNSEVWSSYVYVWG